MTTSYVLELTEDELTVLWGLMQVAKLDREAGPKRKFASIGRNMDRVDGAIDTVTRKVNELMETPTAPTDASTVSKAGSQPLVKLPPGGHS